MKNAVMLMSVLLLLANFTGCISLNSDKSSTETERQLVIDQTSMADTSEVWIEALTNKDAELFKSVFSEQTLKLQTDIDAGIEYIFDMYEGDYIETVYKNQSSESFSDIQAYCVWAIAVIKTTEKCYSLTWTEWTQQESNPSAKGVYSLTFEECEEDQRGAGGGYLLAGVYYPGSEMENNVIDTFFGAMHNKNKEELESVCSDALLKNSSAVKNMDELIERYTPSYTNLLVAWKVNNTICIQLRRSGVFICLHFDDQYTDKISSIRVFNSSDEDEDSISKYKFAQDDVGIYLPD